MAGKREKTVSYRRAEWLGDTTGLTLERCIRDALKVLKTVDDRTILYGGQLTALAKHKDNTAGGLLLHIITETPGEYASVVPKAARKTAALDLKTQPPPADGEWLDGDAFLYVKDDHVCLCATQVYDRAISYYLAQLFEKARLRKDAGHFALMKAADITKVKMIQNQGVKEIEIRTTLYKASLDYVKRTSQVVGVLGAAAKQIKHLLKKPNDYTPDGLKVALTINTDARFTKGLPLGEKRIKDLGLDVVKNHEEGHDDDYSILTKTGQRISPKEIFLKTKVSLDAEGKTVKLDKTWRELVTFHNLLVKTGALEQ